MKKITERKYTKKLAAVLTALMISLTVAGCGNTIEYKAVGGIQGGNDSSSQADDSSSQADEAFTPDIPAIETSEPGDESNDDSSSVGNLTVEAVDEEYFSKTAFIGEALCSGLGLYVKDIDSDYVFTTNNAHVSDITDLKIRVNGSDYKLADGLYASGKKYIYIWLGPNDLCNYKPKAFAQRYEQLINDIIYANPLAYIGVISVAPVSAEYESGLTNGTVMEYNMALAEMIDNMATNRVFFFNVTATLGDDSGHLLSEYDNGDGLHMKSAAYKAVAELLYKCQIHPYLSDFTEIELPDSDDTDNADDTDNPDDTDNTDDTENGEDAGDDADAENAEDCRRTQWSNGNQMYIKVAVFRYI